jgi:hypothetical protein
VSAVLFKSGLVNVIHRKKNVIASSILVVSIPLPRTHLTYFQIREKIHPKVIMVYLLAYFVVPIYFVKLYAN